MPAKSATPRRGRTASKSPGRGRAAAKKKASPSPAKKRATRKSVSRTPRSRSRGRTTTTPAKKGRATSTSRSRKPATRAKRGGKKSEQEIYAPKTTHFEFFGPPGALLIMVALPVVIYFLFFLCYGSYCPAGIPTTLFKLPDWSAFFSVRSFKIAIGWFFFQVILFYVVPGREVPGVVLRDGSRLTYKLNGWACTQVTAVAVAAGQYFGWIDLKILYHEYLQLATAAIVLSTLLSVYLYARSFAPRVILAEGGNSGNPVYDFFIGRELNPRIGDFDLKSFCELRPGLIGWALINTGLALKSYDDLGYWNTAVLFVCAFQNWYVLDALRQEGAILTTMDITTDGFGWMLAFGDLALVPFTYTIQARFLVEHPITLSYPVIASILLLQAIGYTIFRCANSQKDQFRKDPNHPSVRHLKYIDTKRGTRLLISGWWGVVRHLNYVGDWIMALSWCLTCGVTHILPFYYAVYFAVLLVHRELRDEEACRKKYGADWDRYCEHVPYRLIYGIY